MVPGTVQLQFLDMVVDVSAVRRAQCVDKVVAVPVVQVVLGLPSLFFDKVVDMPVVAQLQYVDKVVDFPACRSCCFSRCPSREDSPIPQLTIVEKTVEIPQLQYSLKMVDVPVLAGRAWFPVHFVVETRLPQLRR